MLVTEATQKFESKSQLCSNRNFSRKDVGNRSYPKIWKQITTHPGAFVKSITDVGNRSYPKIWKQITTTQVQGRNQVSMLVTEATQKFESKSQL